MSRIWFEWLPKGIIQLEYVFLFTLVCYLTQIDQLDCQLRVIEEACWVPNLAPKWAQGREMVIFRDSLVSLYRKIVKNWNLRPPWIWHIWLSIKCVFISMWSHRAAHGGFTTTYVETLLVAENSGRLVENPPSDSIFWMLWSFTKNSNLRPPWKWFWIIFNIHVSGYDRH